MKPTGYEKYKTYDKLKHFLWTLYYSQLYSFVDENLCCCGSNHCEGDMSHSFRSAKEYAITCAVEKKLNKGEQQ